MSMENPIRPTSERVPEQEGEGAARPILRVLLWQEGADITVPYGQELERDGWDTQLDVVTTREEFSVRVWSCSYDVVLAEHQPRSGCGVDAVEVLRKFRREIPVILVTGGIGEENVAEALRSGVTDYVAKDRLRRLPIAIRRILSEKLERVDRKRLSEERDRFFMLSGDLLGILDAKGSILQLNPAWQRTLGHEIEALVKTEKKLNPNVDFYSATTYHSLGIAVDLFTPIFAVSRVSGWTAHVLEQYANNRLIRPRADYIGPDYPQRYRPLEDR